MSRKEEFKKKYRGYVIREWIYIPNGERMLIAIPFNAECFVCPIDSDVSEKEALKTIKRHVDEYHVKKTQKTVNQG